MTNKKVLLVHPGSPVVGFVYPLGLVYIARYLNDLNIDVEIFQMGTTSIRQLKPENYLFVGISLSTGFMISNGLKVAKLVKRFNKDIPIVLGGVHPSILPEESLRNELVDIVVIGDGEETIKEVANALIQGGGLENVEGIGYKDINNNIIINPRRKPVNLDDLEIDLPYKLLGKPFEYATVMPVHTSRGCPHGCRFCFNAGFSGRTYRMKSAERVVKEIEFLINKYGIRNFNFDYEDEFFINIDRAVNIFELILKNNLAIHMSTYCRFDNFVRGVDKYGEGFLKLMKDAGVRQLFFGAESGSQRILDDVMKKGITVEQIIKSVDLLKKYEIPHLASFILATPGETEKDLSETMQLINKLSENNKYILNSLNIYTPLPKTELMEYLKKDFNFKEPDTLEEWGNYRNPIDFKDMTWHDKTYLKKVKVLSKLSKFPFYIDFESFGDYKKYRYHSDRLPVLGYLFSKLARWRYLHNNYICFIEPDIYAGFINLYSYLRNILVDNILKRFLSKRLFVSLKNIFGNKEW